uniref:Uncharacterized protein n=1 Tax=Rhizophora mucronata TaxID=61149 RepID=A0A2P2PQJ1_RHIMU
MVMVARIGTDAPDYLILVTVKYLADCWIILFYRCLINTNISPLLPAAVSVVYSAFSHYRTGYH